MKDNCFTFERYLFALGIFTNHIFEATGNDPQLCNSSVFVCGFFSISGLLVYGSLLRSRSREFTGAMGSPVSPVIPASPGCPAILAFPVEYARKRFVRIYPAYAIVILLSVLLGLALTTLPACDYLTSYETWRYLAVNLLFLNFLQPTLPGLFTDHVFQCVNGALWTLKVEVLFYLLLPLAAWLMRRYGSRTVTTIIIALSLLYSLATCIGYNLTHLPQLYTLQHQIPGMLSYFFIPILMFHWKEWVMRHGRTLLLLSALVCVLGLSFGVMDIVQPIFLPVLVVTFAYECRSLLFTARWTDYTYEFYLLHFPVIQTVISLFHFDTLAETALVAFPLTCLLAVGLHRITNPIRPWLIDN